MVRFWVCRVCAVGKTRAGGVTTPPFLQQAAQCVLWQSSPYVKDAFLKADSQLSNCVFGWGLGALARLCLHGFGWAHWPVICPHWDKIHLAT